MNNRDKLTAWLSKIAPGVIVWKRHLPPFGKADRQLLSGLRLQERVIAEAIDAEFRAYMALPEIKVDELEQWFIVDSPAMREIVNILLRHAERGWIISNPINHSTKRLLSVKIKAIDNDEAHINTIKYWYLKWWDQKNGAYVYPYRETNRQMYVLKSDMGVWRVYENNRPLPRTSRILRRNRRANR